MRHVLDQRRLGVAPRVANVDDEGNPAIVDDSLTVTLTLSPDVPPAQERETYASELDGLDDPFLQTKSAQRRRSTRGGRSPLSPLKAFWVVRGTVTEEGVSGNAEDFSRLSSASAADLRACPRLRIHTPKMPLAAGSSAVYVQNTAPGFVSTPG